MDRTLESYGEKRDALLIKIAETLSKDERFVAGWLTGSLSRNDADSFSDIDLRLVVSDEHSRRLCTRLEQVSAQTSPDRYTFFSQFGTPALIHENNNNAPEGGTFTFVLYADSAIMVDWVLMPRARATRPLDSRLLFDKVGIPPAAPPEPEDVEQSKKSVAEMWAFFWMMTAITIKYAVRDDGVFVTQWTEHLHTLVYEIERRLNREPWKYQRGSRSQFQPTRKKQLESIRGLCDRMLELKSKVSSFTGSEPLTPISEIHYLLLLAHNGASDSKSHP
jgi:predicted nucleotidyltransferase